MPCCPEAVTRRNAGANPGLSRNCDREGPRAVVDRNPGARDSGCREVPDFGRGSPGRAGSMATTDHTYPFAGIVGMADIKLALLLNAVSPAIGGVLVRGEKGTAKSTMVRGLAALLPPVSVVPGCPYSCDSAD